jgi:hypothetical protein
MKKLVLVAVLVGMAGGAMAQGLTVVEGGKSAYVIYREAGAAPSVILAAQEVQRVIKISTGVELAIVDQPPAAGGTPAPRGGAPRGMICLGDNAAARQAGVAVAGLKDDGFIIMTRGGKVYIAGREYPNDQPPFRGFTSKGTLIGSYAFLERVVGVRWLMPTEVGEDIPAHQTLKVGALNVREEPDLALRYLVDIGENYGPQTGTPVVAREWARRNRLMDTRMGRRIEHGHAWDQYIPKEEWLAHPEWLSKDEQGKPRDYTKHTWAVKFCTSTPELVERFAAGVSKWLDEHPTFKSASMSPSDGGDFCQCEKCTPQIVKDPNGRPSYTPLILKFYNDLARIVGQKHPDRMLAGYVYYSYMYPPPEPMKLEPNVWLVWAPLNYYGFGLLKPVYAEEYKQVAAGWLKLTHNFVYHNYGIWMRSFNGAILPVPRKILALEIPTLQRLGAYGVDIVGQGAWGYSGPTNYIVARLEWDAQQDVNRLRSEWLGRAYGPGAPAMTKLYDLVEQSFTRHKEKESPVYKGEMYEVNTTVAENVYAPIFAEMERLYLEAMGCVEAHRGAMRAREKQKRRLEMFGDNLIMLHWGMTRAGVTWPGAEQSCFHRTDEEYEAFVKDRGYAWWLYGQLHKPKPVPIWKGEWQG